MGNYRACDDLRTQELATAIKNFFSDKFNSVERDKIFKFSVLILLELSGLVGTLAYQGPPIRSL